MEDIYKKMEAWFVFEKKYNVALGILEGLLGLIAGSFIHALIGHDSPFNLWMTVATSLIFVILFLRRLLREKFFPLSGIGELKASTDIQTFEREIERKIL